jgi:hypothetical protein
LVMHRSGRFWVTGNGRSFPSLKRKAKALVQLIVINQYSEMAVDLVEYHKQRGVRVLTSARPTAVDGHGTTPSAVLLEDGRSIEADLVVGIGNHTRRRASPLRRAQGQNGIVTDAVARPLKRAFTPPDWAGPMRGRGASPTLAPRRALPAGRHYWPQREQSKRCLIINNQAVDQSRARLSESRSFYRDRRPPPPCFPLVSERSSAAKPWSCVLHWPLADQAGFNQNTKSPSGYCDRQ